MPAGKRAPPLTFFNNRLDLGPALTDLKPEPPINGTISLAIGTKGSIE